ncbi:translocation/assembly module TamB domain-containing protein [Nitrincola schmidtii]|uniref:translocation/assembly module TamB domain-containing protein n=1 Tax=Nitrincola schmidtii TaxID=1730894 RepID=UPI00124CE3D9|nr:translocation/assembly module TamB domain-containing protein [Nitrincola schmidtii]
MILKRLLLYPLLLIFILIYLLLSIVYVPGVPSLALKVSKGFIPEDIHIGSISGSFSGVLILKDIQYKQDDTLITLDSALLEWKPSCLLRSHLCIDNIQLDGLSLHLPESQNETEPSTEPFSLPDLPDITLPITLQLDAFQINDIEVFLGEQQFTLEKVALSVAFTDQLSIDSFQLQQGNTRIDWQAQIQPSGHYDLSSNLNWFIETADIENILNQALDLPVNSPIVGSLAINGDLQELSVALENQLSTELTGPVSLKLLSKVAPYQETLTIENFLIKLTDTLAEISLTGELNNWFDPEMDFALTAKEIIYPLIDEGEPTIVQVPEANLTLKGQLSDFQMGLQTSLSGHDIPEITVNFNGSGNLESFNEFTLSAALLGGEIDIQGSANWAEQISWDTRVWVRNLNPGQFNPELEGNVQVELVTRGQLEESGPNLFIDLIDLSGVFREQTLRGQGQVAYSTNAIDIDSLLLGLGVTQLDVNGTMQNEQLALNFNLNAPNLSTLLPDLAGQLRASGQVNGPMMTPEIRADISGEGLAFQENKVAEITGRIRADISGASDSDIDLTLTNVNVAGDLLDSVQLTLNGKPDAHRLKLTTVGELINLYAEINGRFDQAQSSYAGRLSDLELDRSEIGRWTQSNTSNFSFQAPSFRLEQTCLVQSQGEAQLCLSANRNNSNRLSADFSLSDLSLRLLDPFLQGVEVESNLNVSGQFSQQGTQHPEAQFVVSTTPGRLMTPDDQPDFDLDPIRLDANLSGDNLRAELSALFSEMDGQVLANINVQQLSRQQLLTGDINLSLNDLAMISVFAPAVQAIEGQLEGRFSLAGSLTAPIIRGFFDLQNGAAELPAQGIRLSPLQLSIRSEGEEGEKMTLQGLIGSGNGEIRLNGEFNLASMEGLLTIKGEDFEAMATEINLLISPDMSIRVDDAIRVGGSITVPYAYITPPRQQAQNAIRASEDVVFVDDEAESFSERNLPLITDLQLILGDSVVVNAFGFNGRLLGRLRIQDDGMTATRASGSIQVESGDYRLFGQNMTIQRGSLIFSGGPIDNPGLDLRVSRTVDTVEAGARIVGTLLNPEFSLFSVPAMPDSSIMSYLVLGRGPGESSASEQSMMLQAAMALTMQGGNTITGQLREELSLDEFGFDTDDAGSSAFFIGKYLTPRLYIRYGVSLLESVEVLTLSYRLSSMWKVETQSSSVGSGADFFYTRER